MPILCRLGCSSSVCFLHFLASSSQGVKGSCLCLLISDFVASPLLDTFIAPRFVLWVTISLLLGVEVSLNNELFGGRGS